MESPLMIGQQPIQCYRTAMKLSLIPQAMTYTNQPALDLTNCSLLHPLCHLSGGVYLDCLP